MHLKKLEIWNICINGEFDEISAIIVIVVVVVEVGVGLNDWTNTF